MQRSPWIPIICGDTMSIDCITMGAAKMIDPQTPPQISWTIFLMSRHSRARTVRLFYLYNLPDTIVLLCCCPMRCCVAELVTHFTLHALRTALYMLIPGL